jgi:hypothetical protein
VPERTTSEDEQLKVRRVEQADAPQDASGSEQTPHPIVASHAVPSGRGNGSVRASTITAAQQTYGNRIARRMVQSTNVATPVQRDKNDTKAGQSQAEQRELMQMMAQALHDMDEQVRATQGRAGDGAGKPQDHAQKTDANIERLQGLLKDVEDNGWLSAIGHQVVEALNSMQSQAQSSPKSDQNDQGLDGLLGIRDIFLRISTANDMAQAQEDMKKANEEMTMLSNTLRAMQQAQTDVIKNIR